MLKEGACHEEGDEYMYLYFVVSRRIICNNVQHGGTVTLHSTNPERTVRTSALVKEKEKMRTSHREIRIKAHSKASDLALL